VRAQYDVDILRRRTGFTQTFEIGRVKLMKAWSAGPVFVISGATIEQDRVPASADQPRMHAGDQAIMVRRVVVWNQPVAMPFKHPAIKADEELFGRKAGIAQQFPNSGNTDVAYFPSRHFRPSILLELSPSFNKIAAMHL
jgi:hypothetical protein